MYTKGDSGVLDRKQCGDADFFSVVSGFLAWLDHVIAPHEGGRRFSGSEAFGGRERMQFFTKASPRDRHTLDHICTRLSCGRFWSGIAT